MRQFNWRVAYWLTTGVCFILSCGLFSPGSMGNDSLTQWYQVNGILPLSDWHPPLVVHLWSFMNLFIKGPFGLLLFQQALYWSGISLIVYHLVGARTPWQKFYVMLFLGFFPVTWFAMACVWKDALMLSALLFSVGVFLVARKSNYKLCLFTISSLALVLGCGFRHNAMFAVLPLVLMMAYDLFSHLTAYKKVPIGIGLFLVILFFSRIANTVDVDKHYPYLINQVVLWNLAGLSINADEMIVPTEAFLDKDSASVEVLNKYYNDASNNNLVFSSGIVNPKIWEDDEVGKAFLESGLKLISKHPKEYFDIRLRSLKELSGYGRWMPYMAYIFETKYWKGDEGLGLPLYHMKNPNTLRFLEANVAVRLAHFGFFNVVPYLSFLLLTAIIWIVKWERTLGNSLNRIYLGLAFSGLLYWLPYIIIAPSNDFRYHLWTIQTTIIILVIGSSNALHKYLKKRINHD